MVAIDVRDSGTVLMLTRSGAFGVSRCSVEERAVDARARATTTNGTLDDKYGDKSGDGSGDVPRLVASGCQVEYGHGSAVEGRGYVPVEADGSGYSRNALARGPQTDGNKVSCSEVTRSRGGGAQCKTFTVQYNL